jgi:hypothetical protein
VAKPRLSPESGGFRSPSTTRVHDGTRSLLLAVRLEALFSGFRTVKNESPRGRICGSRSPLGEVIQFAHKLVGKRARLPGVSRSRSTEHQIKRLIAQPSFRLANGGDVSIDVFRADIAVKTARIGNGKLRSISSSTGIKNASLIR